MSKALTNLFFDTHTRYLASRVFNEHVRPYKSRFIKAIFFMILAAVSNSAFPYLLKPTIDHIFINGNVTSLITISGAVFLAALVHGLSSFTESYMMASIGQNIITDLQNRLFKHLVKADLAYFHQNSTGELLSRFISDVHLMRASVSNVIVGLGKDFISLICLVALMFWCDWILASIAFVILPSVIFPLSKMSRKMRKATYSTQEETALLTTHLTQTFQGMRLVKSYCMESYEVDRTKVITERLLHYITKAIQARSYGHPIVIVLGGLTTTAIIAYGGLQVMSGTRTPGDFMSFIAALALCYEPLKRLSSTSANLQEGLVAATRVFKELDISPTIISPENAIKKDKIEGRIDIKDVSFAYGDNPNVLSKISLHVEPGKTIALVGASGSGKSTIINLIPRFFDVAQGRILIDGIDVRDWNLNSLREKIALVSQEVTLFDDTVRNNIAYGKFDASEEEIIAAAKAAAAHDFIMKLPQQYNTIVGENGITLSGGQRQRVSIARAMLKNAPILLLDEATSALDSHSEALIQVTLNTLMQGRTTIAVAHRLSTIMHADRIYVFDHGQIIEEGTHQDLLAQNGPYSLLWSKQTSNNTFESEDVSALDYSKTT